MKTVKQISTGKVLRAQMHDIVGEDEMLVDDILTVPMIDPYYINGQFVEMATPDEIEQANRLRVPQTASKMRFFLALFNIGITRNIVYDVINQIPDNTLKEIVLIKFDLSQEFDRNDEHLNMLANHFNITQEQLDNLFIQANE